MGSSPWIPAGNRPSFSSFSNAIISCKLVACRIRSCNRFFSSPVSFILDSLDVCAEPFAETRVFDFLPRICIALALASVREYPDISISTAKSQLFCRVWFLAVWFSRGHEERYLQSKSCRLFFRPKQLSSTLSLHILHLDIVEETHALTPPEHPVPVVLLLSHRIVHQHQMCQPAESPQDIQVRQLAQLVRRQHQICQVGHRVRQRRLDTGDAIPRQQ